MASVAQFLAELKRRRVIRALVAWGIAAFAILQATEPLMHGLHLPEWTLSFVVVMLGAGFPVTAALAWTFDLTAEGIARTEASTAPDPAAAAGSAAGKLRLALLLGGLGVAAAAPGLVYFFVRQGPARRAEAPAAPAAPFGQQPPAAADAKPSIAVLPFVNMSSDREQEYFSDGITEEILNALAQVDGLRVIGRTSSFAMKGKNEDLRTVGQRLDAANVLEGSVRKAGSRVRITAQLIETGRGSHTWSQQFDRELTDVFAVQEEIARAVVAALQVKLLAAPTRPVRAVDPQAHDLYLRGIVLVRLGSGEGAEQAVPLLQQAVERDPAYPQAWAELGRALFLAADQGSADPKTYWPRARAAVDRAIAAGPDVPDGYLVRSMIRQGVQDWVGAQEDAERAQLVAPGSATALLRHGSLLRTLGRLDEAVAVVERAAALDPLAHASHQSLAFSYLGLRRYPEAEAAARRAVELAPQNGQTARTLGFALLMQGRLEEARAAFHGASNFLYQRMGDVMVEHTLGRNEASQRVLNEILASPDVPRWSYQVAQVYAWRGEPDRAFQWLDRATEVHDAGLQHLKNDPIIAKLQGDPRFARLLARLKLPAG